MELKRRLALVFAILSIGLGAGHLVQSKSANSQMAGPAEAAPPGAVKPAETAVIKPDSVQTLSAEAKPVTSKPETAELEPIVPPAELAALEDPAAPPPVATPTDITPAAPVAALPVAPATTLSAADACPVTLDLAARDSAVIAVTLLAPCHPEERVVLRHGGLAIATKTSSTGSLFIDIPALQVDATLSARLADDTTVERAISVPEAAGLTRFGVQWLADDAFQLHAFEGGADYGTSGHVSAQNPRQLVPGMPVKGGWLARLGDPGLDLPMLAEIYTFPTDGTAVNVVVEAAVTDATCQREMIGETMTMTGGDTYVTDLALAMPDCAAKGDILVLKNLVPDMKLAAK